ncbi:SPBc2 prophage-derived aminoglycoside N(3')-acetyltransferase-like protein YokD [Fusarium falciforme]|uniref:SPBc2 prophage-derived aminoglycoside N(3')-acetyltransferase-like protein YokD n=1 Tax=Fusarium falciforme TaxID=195108 RepID=UPI0022FFE631|nr:SPBc2 prophage-derived aminoglycoside N(3')-acetyltransferase-like protein YokD [Fusarium falciforme]WAO97118.1 SPBc2 prophage-derived aminoglycoside N(3')-acetyltransferase-like protein YokD [Fusarium falciforme]
MHPSLPKGPLCTRSSLANNLRSLGLSPGDTVLVHSSLSRIGWINGGAETLVHSLLDVLAPQGTLVVPTHTGSNSDPAGWVNPPVPQSWWQTIRDTMPVFDVRTSRTERMGVVSETVRTWPGAVRSMHPQTSFSAIGANSKVVTEAHALDSLLGDESPLTRLEDVDAKVLLLGVGFDVCTCFHLAEYRINSRKADNSFAALVDGKRTWMTVLDVAVSNDDFLELGKDFVAETGLTNGKIGGAECWLFSLPQAVKFAEKWFASHRVPA